MSEIGSMFEGIDETAPEEVVTLLASGAGCRVERIVSTGQSSPEGFWYDQDEREWVLLVAGRAGLEIEGRGVVELAPGDWVDLPAHCRHRVAWTADDRPTIWLAVFYGAEAPGGLGET